MNTATETAPVYLIDNHCNLHIQAGEQRMVLQPQSAQELLKFLERTQFTQNVNGLGLKGAQQ